jgi:hypothetical protein
VLIFGKQAIGVISVKAPRKKAALQKMTRLLKLAANVGTAIVTLPVDEIRRQKQFFGWFQPCSTVIIDKIPSQPESSGQSRSAIQEKPLENDELVAGAMKAALQTVVIARKNQKTIHLPNVTAKGTFSLSNDRSAGIYSEAKSGFIVTMIFRARAGAGAIAANRPRAISWLMSYERTPLSHHRLHPHRPAQG